MNVNMRFICIFWSKLFRQKTAKFSLFFFDLKKAQGVEKHREFQSLKKISVRKQPNFKIFKKVKFLTLLLEYTTLYVMLYPVLRVSEQL